MQDANARYKYSGDGKPSAAPLVRARSLPDSPTASTSQPSRELIQRSLQQYKKELEQEGASYSVVGQRLQRDLSPFSVLKLSGFSLGDKTIRLLSHALRSPTASIETLDLGFNRISDRGALYLANALAVNTSIKNMYLSGNEIGVKGVQSLSESLKLNTTLQSLHLSGNNIGDEGAVALALGLELNTGLNSLYLGTNGIGSMGMAALSKSLTKNKHLTELTLGQNKIGSAGAVALASSFTTNSLTHLLTLEIGKNEIGNEGVLQLAQALSCSRNSIQNLYLDNNPLGDEGGAAIGRLLAHNSSLRVVDLSYSQLSLVGLRELSRGLALTTSLLCLVVDGHDWASTRFIQSSSAREALQGVALSKPSAQHFAASCVLQAVKSNLRSKLRKLAGVDLSLALNNQDKQVILGDDEQKQPHFGSSTSSVSGKRFRAASAGSPEMSNYNRSSDDVLSRNDQVLQFFQTNRTVQTQPPRSLKRKTSEERAKQESPQKDGKMQKRVDSRESVNSTHSYSSGSDRGSQTRLSSNSLNSQMQAMGKPPRPPSLQPPVHQPKPQEGNLSLKSPRYESTMEGQAKQVVLAIGKLPFNEQELQTLTSYYLPQTACEDAKHCGKEECCSVCSKSRLARYPRMMQYKTEQERHGPLPPEQLLLLLRQLHYLAGAFQHVPEAAATVDRILASIYESK